MPDERTEAIIRSQDALIRSQDEITTLDEKICRLKDASADSPKTLDEAVEACAARAQDKKSMKQLRIITRYDWYLREFQTLKTYFRERSRAEKRLRGSMRQQFPPFEIWKHFDSEEFEQLNNDQFKRTTSQPHTWARVFAARVEGLP